MGLSKKSRRGISVGEFGDALPRIPEFLPTDLQSLGVDAAEAKQIAPTLGDALRTYALAHLSDMGIASAWRANERLTRRKESGLMPGEKRLRGRIMKYKQAAPRGRHFGDVHMLALIESVLLAYVATFGDRPTISKEYGSGAGGHAALFVHGVLHRYAARLQVAAPEIATRLRPSPAAVVKRIAASHTYREFQILRDDDRPE